MKEDLIESSSVFSVRQVLCNETLLLTNNLAVLPLLPGPNTRFNLKCVCDRKHKTELESRRSIAEGIVWDTGQYLWWL